MSETKEESPAVVIGNAIVEPDQCMADGSSLEAEAKAVAEEEKQPAPVNEDLALDHALDEAWNEMFGSVNEAPVLVLEAEEEFAPDPGIIKRINPRLLYQPFWAKVEQLLKNCAARGVQYFITAGLRTFEEQDKLFAQGRKAPGKIVTNAKGGESTHNYGIAVDFTHDQSIDVRGLQPDWVVENYRVLAEEAEKLGLEPGFRWQFQDAPHVQLKIGRHLDLHQLQDIYRSAGQEGVKHLLDQFQW